MTALYVRGTPRQRFMARVEHPHWQLCWRWLGSRSADGYGRFSLTARKRVYAHRWLYELVRGPLPPGLQLDHLCHNRSCVNPAHLEPVTARENTLRGRGVAALHARKTRCARGHAFTPTNTIRYGPGRRWRDCRQCRLERARALR